MSYKGFKDRIFFDRFAFSVEDILVRKQYYRLITSSFLHNGWTHLILNMVSLYFFSGVVELFLGGFNFLIIYFSTMIGGDLLALYIHRNHGDYRAVGASGAVCGVIFAYIALFPGGGISLFLLPLAVPAWLYGLLYMLYSIFGIRSQYGNVGHEAHLGGALTGMLVALAMRPAAFMENIFLILLIMAPVLVFLYLIVKRRHMLVVGGPIFKSATKDENQYDIDHRYNQQKHARQQEIDRILDKISMRGINSLTKEEKEKLDKYSKRG